MQSFPLGINAPDGSRLVNAILDMAERMAKRIDLILEAGGDAVLDHAGHISAEFAKQFAEAEFEKYRTIQDRSFSSDFDRFISDIPLLPDSTTMN